MNCSEIQSRFFYEVEDDPSARALLEDHLAGCPECKREHAAYTALLEGYATERDLLLRISDFGLRIPQSAIRNPQSTWRWIRVAAVVSFAILGSLLLPEFRDSVPTNTQKQIRPVHSWDYSVPSTYASSSFEENSMDFKMKVDDLQNRILELRSRSALDRF